MDCSTAVFSDDYFDLIEAFDRGYYPTAQSPCSIPVNSQYQITYWLRSQLPPLNATNYTYSAIPKCYGLMDTAALEASGILQVRNQPALSLYGEGVLIGFVDTGIDYTSDLFRYSDGSSRILRIWDQTDTTGTPPDTYVFGSEYTKADLDLALSSDDPYAIVPQRDILGHGSTLAAAAAGNISPSGDFSGAAPFCGIAMVKLKEAKAHLKEFYFIPESAPAYSEADLMLAVSYLSSVAEQLNMPLVICIGLGTNMGDHTGSSPLCSYLDLTSSKQGHCVVLPTGNEAASRHHYKGILPSTTQTDIAEIRVEEGCEGFTLELWSSAPDLYTIEIISPVGETVPRLPFMRGISDVYDFIFADTKIYVDYRIVERRRGDQLIFLRFENPVGGLWQIRIFRLDNTTATSTGELSPAVQPFHMWLPIDAFLSKNVYFVRSDPTTTLTEPGCTASPITVAGYNTVSNSLSPESGWGYTRDNRIKPDFAAPVNASVPGSADSGTSLAAALTAGAAALFFEWGIVDQKEPAMNGIFLKNNLIRGTSRSASRTYPNEEWGYGTLNLYRTFDIYPR